MDMETYYNQFKNCMQDEKPYCSDDCPFHMDVLDFQDKLSQKRYSAAYKIFRNATAFPDIIATICEQYCTERCPRGGAGGDIQINLLEKTCVAKTKRKDPNQYNLPPKKGRVAVIGAGLSGLSCALRLASRKYDVVIYEKESFVGGSLRGLLPEDVYKEDIDRQFKYEEYSLRLDTEIKSLRDLSGKGFDAVYVATGSGGSDFGTLSCDGADNGSYAFSADGTAVFAGGGLLGKDVVRAAAEGLDTAVDIEGYLKTGIIRYHSAPEKTKVNVNTAGLADMPPVTPTDVGVFTDEETDGEIARCLRCQCDACRDYCDLTEYFDKWPLQMRDEIMTTTMPATSMIHKAPAIRLINMCTQCGRCNETCPGRIELGNMIKEARRMLHKIDRMPGAYHQFWVRDMEFANGRYAAIAKCPPGRDSCGYAFFPGCHLGAADPAYVDKTYSALLSANGDIGLLLRCCGVPADWAGNEALHSEAIASLKSDWESMGKPTLIMACPSCTRHFREYLPEIPVVSLYKMLDDLDVPVRRAGGGCETYAVFDPCSARNDDAAQGSVRRLLSKAGVPYRELPGGAEHGCCGFGGNIEIAGPKLADSIAKKRSLISDAPYIVYCINCRDVFHGEGKPVRHILDMLFDIDPPEAELPTVTDRRGNRVALKELLLEKIWGETMNEKPKLKYELTIGPAIKAKMNSLKLLDEDICYILEMGEEHGRRTYDTESGSYKCYREIRHITGWVEYRPVDCEPIDRGPLVRGYEILNVYTHRMKIELEVVWNGRKTDSDLR